MLTLIRRSVAAHNAAARRLMDEQYPTTVRLADGRVVPLKRYSR